MEFTETEQRRIAGRARTLHERLEGPPNSPGGEPPLDPDSVLTEWKDRFPSEEAFQARLDRDGFTEDAVRDQLSATGWPDEEPLPSWLETVEDLLDYVESASPGDRRAGSASGAASETETESDETPFSELLAVLAAYAREQLPETVVPIDAASPMNDWLLTRLEAVCLRPFYVEFKSFVEAHDPELVDADADDFADPPTTLYSRFVDAMFDVGFKNLCLEYPVLARHVARIVDQWVEAVVEVSRRIASDASALREQFGVSGAVRTLEPLSDDAHACGRVPVRVSFESGAVVYKPRPVDGGVAFYEIVERLDEHLSIPSIATPTYVSRDGYGWMEPVEYRDLPDESASKRYYERAGAVLCLAYVLNFPDGQLENLIVDGSDPTLVDCETVFHPQFDPIAKPLRTEISGLVDHSVLLTSLLPWSQGDPREQDSENVSAAVAGFGAESEQTQLSSLTEPTIEAANTDVMSVRQEPVEVGVHTNTPTIDDVDRPPGEYVAELVRGFEATYETIADLHSEGRFVSEIAPPEVVAGIENRMVYRATVWYRSIQQSAVARDPLRDGARLSVEYEDLAIPFFDGRIETSRHWPVFEAERRALRRRDVPRFTSRTDGRTLFHDGEPLGFEAETSGYDRCRRRLDEMDATDRQLQTWLIRETFDASDSRTSPPPANAVAEERFEAAAVDLFEDAIEAGIETADGTGWLSVSSGYGDVCVTPADHSLYWGRGGIALTAAALHRTTGRERYRTLAEETLAPVLDECAAGDLSVGLGGTKGIGAIVYALSVVSELLDAERYRNAASTASKTVTADLLSDDDTFDVMEGAAGTLLGLLAYHDRYGGGGVLDRAIDCGDRLLDARVSIDGHRTWNTTEDDVQYTGFAHGSSGIAYALARLAGATGESRYAEAAREALDWESTLYAESKRNWPTSLEADDYLDRWCHGRSGMALARIGILEHLADAGFDEHPGDAGLGEQLADTGLGGHLDLTALRDDVNAALAETATAEPAPIDNVCCGNLGRVETLLIGARRADGNRADAVELAGRCLTRRASDGILSLPGHSRSFVNPTFFDGVSGAAYQLLRLRNPDALPCVLLLE
jgi:type 2 lantibiotic biosynthesis protein LanM